MNDLRTTLAAALTMALGSCAMTHTAGCTRGEIERLAPPTFSEMNAGIDAALAAGQASDRVRTAEHETIVEKLGGDATGLADVGAADRAEVAAIRERQAAQESTIAAFLERWTGVADTVGLIDRRVDRVEGGVKRVVEDVDGVEADVDKIDLAARKSERQWAENVATLKASVGETLAIALRDNPGIQAMIEKAGISEDQLKLAIADKYDELKSQIAEDKKDGKDPTGTILGSLGALMGAGTIATRNRGPSRSAPQVADHEARLRAQEIDAALKEPPPARVNT